MLLECDVFLDLNGLLVQQRLIDDVLVVLVRRNAQKTKLLCIHVPQPLLLRRLLLAIHTFELGEYRLRFALLHYRVRWYRHCHS